jgi:hypothetical protein
MALRNVVWFPLVTLASLAFAQAPNASLPRPPVDDRVQALGAALLDAVVHDDPARADAQFFPRDAFLQVKAMQNPGRYWDRLHARFAADVHALHASIKGIERAELDHFELARRGGLVQPGEEGNRLPYWASRHSRLHFRIDKVAQSFEVRVVISWENRWYLIHLSEFHNPARA